MVLNDNGCNCMLTRSTFWISHCHASTVNRWVVLLNSTGVNIGSILIYASAAARWRGCVYVLQSVFFVVVVRHNKVHKYETTVLATAEQIFMKLLPNDRGKNLVFNVVPKWGPFCGAKNWKIAKNRESSQPGLPTSWQPGCQLARLLAASGCVKKAWARECI